MFIQFTSDYSVQTTGISIKYVSSDRTVTGRILWEDPDNYVRRLGHARFQKGLLEGFNTDNVFF